MTPTGWMTASAPQASDVVMASRHQMPAFLTVRYCMDSPPSTDVVPI